MPDLVVVTKEGHVATVTLARPTMPPAFFTECERAFRSLAEDSSVRAVVVRSESKAFSYGLDLPAARRLTHALAETRQRIRDERRGGHDDERELPVEREQHDAVRDDRQRLARQVWSTAAG